ncbi:MAG: PPC domain-containing protein, partial [Deltaproteobacteria bacterium]|nr:PPC domain-containing protein [Deltaproteobacteria bacterium]
AFEGLSEDKEPNDAPAQAQTLAQRALQSGQEASTMYGLLDPKTDADVFKFKTPKNAKGLYLNFQPSGATNGNGSTGNIGLVNVWNALGTTLLAQLDYGQATAQVKSSGDYGFSSVPAMAETEYLIEIKRKAGAAVGANDFYVFTGFSSDALNPQETDDVANGMLAGAEPTMGMVNQTDPTYTNRFIGGGIPAGDTDFWKFDATKDENVIVACSARRAGAGVEDFTVTLVDKDGKTLQTEAEDASKDLLWSNDSPNASMTSFKVKTTGTYYLKLTATKSIMDGATLGYYLCGLHTQSP